MVRFRRRDSWLAPALALSASLWATGCVERRYTVRTDPPGALVVVNGEEVGPSPASKSFVYYGDREVQIYQDGYKTQRFVQPINAPWWDNNITDFFTENLLPITLRDEREYVYKMEPVTTPPTGELLERGKSLRAQANIPPTPRRRGILAWLGFR